MRKKEKGHKRTKADRRQSTAGIRATAGKMQSQKDKEAYRLSKERR